jgi:hypothetical protein
MKYIIFFTYLIIISVTVSAQYDKDTVEIGWMSTIYTLNFDKPNPDMIVFDPPENNIWQIGKPNKEPFTPFTGDQAIMTDTLNMLDSALEHSFILKFNRLEESNSVREWWVQFMNNYDFNSLSGGYISVSYDKGDNWINVIYDDYLFDDTTGSIAMLNLLYDSTSAQLNSQLVLTGSYTSIAGHPSSVGKFFSCTIWDAVLVYDIWLKFTYLNTGKGIPHVGWMIDDLTFEIDTWCEYIYDEIVNIEESEITIYPNPAKEAVTLSYPDAGINPFTLIIYDLGGTKVLEQSGLCKNSETIDISRLPNGYYFCFLNNSKQRLKNSLIIQK